MYLFKTPIMPVPPNKIKYSTVYDGKSIKADNFSIGVNSDVDYGPTLSTNYWNGIVPPISGYAVYINKGSQGPSIYAPQNDAQLVSITNFLAGSKVANNATDALFWFNSQSDKFVTNIDYPDVVTNGLSMMVDAGYVSSYCRSGSTWNDLSFSGFNATLQSSPTFTLSGNGYFNFALASSQYATFSDLGTLSNFSCEVWAKQNSLPATNSFPTFITNTYVSGNYVNYTIGYTSAPWDGKIYGGFFNGTWQLPSSGFTPTTDRWYHYAVTYDGSKIIFYVDGKYYSSGSTSTPAISSGSGGRFMRRWDIAEYIDGNLLNAKVYNRALSSTEITQNYYSHGIANGFITTGLVLYFDAGNILSYQGSGTLWKDMTTSASHVRLTNGPTYSSVNKGVIVFDGLNEYASGSTTFSTLDLVDKSFVAWIKPTSLSQYGLLDKDFDTGPGVYGGWGFWMNGSGKLWFWNHSNLDLIDNGSLSISSNAWNFVTITYDSTAKSAKFYYNGSLSSTQTNASIVEKSSSTIPINIGSLRSASSSFFPGSMGLVAAYNKVLSQSEITQLYNVTKSRFGL